MSLRARMVLLERGDTRERKETLENQDLLGLLAVLEKL